MGTYKEEHMIYSTIIGDVYYGEHAPRRGVQKYLKWYVRREIMLTIIALINAGIAIYLAILSWGM